MDHLIEALDSPEREQTVFQIATAAEAPNIVNVPRFPGPVGRRRGWALWHFNWRLSRLAPRLLDYDALIVHYPFHAYPLRRHPRIIALSHGVEWRQPPRRLTHRVRRRIARWAVGHCRATVSNDTNFLRETGIDSQPTERPFTQHRPGVWFIPNCVDVARFENAAPQSELQALNPILVPRNASPARGIHLAIDAFGRFAKNHPVSNLLIAGNHPAPAYQEQLSDLIARHGIAERVIFAGNIDWESMPAYYRSARMTLVPTLFCEGTSLAALESMAAGTPAISTRVGGLADLPTEKCDPDAESLARAMEAVHDNRDEIGAKQQAVVREEFSLSRWNQVWNQVLEQVLQ